MAKLICENCGAPFDAKEPKCPNCGFISYPGAEEKFMQDLEEVHEDLAEVVEEQAGEYKKELSKQTKKTVLICSIVAVIVLLFFGAFVLINYLMEKHFQSDYDPKTEMLWERENYPKLDELYEQGKYEEIVEFENSLYDNRKNTHSLSNWQYNWFITVYRSYEQVNYYMDLLDQGEQLTKLEGGSFTYYAMWLYSDKTEDEYFEQTITDKEKAIAEEYSKEMRTVLSERLKMTEEEIEDLYNQCMEAGYFSGKPCYKFGEKHYKRFQ